MHRRLNQANQTTDSIVELDTSIDKVRTSRRHLRRLNTVEIDALVASRLAGEEIGVLAERFRIDRNTVMSHLKRRGVPSRR